MLIFTICFSNEEFIPLPFLAFQSTTDGEGTIFYICNRMKQSGSWELNVNNRDITDLQIVGKSFDLL